MNGEVAQLCNIVIAAKKALQTETTIDYLCEEYVKNLTFVFSKGDFYSAKSVSDWYTHCLEKGLQDVKYATPTTVKERGILGFSNTSGSSIVCFFTGDVVSYFTPEWAYKNDGWDILYTERLWKNAPKGKPLFSDNTKDFKKVLQEIAAFADKIGFQGFANIFTKAFDILEGTGVNDTYYAQYLKNIPMPESNVRLFCAAEIADVFGAMGSWNDSPSYEAYERGLEKQYDMLSGQLLTQIRLALLFAVNQW